MRYLDFISLWTLLVAAVIAYFCGFAVYHKFTFRI